MDSEVEDSWEHKEQRERGISVMDLGNCLEEFKSLKKRTDLIVKLLDKVARLDQEGATNLSDLRKELAKLSDISHEQTQSPAATFESLAVWVKKKSTRLEEIESERTRRFGNDLAEALKQENVTLSGQLPDLKTGVMTLEVEFNRSQIVIWFGPKQERLGQCTLSIGVIVDTLRKIRAGLGIQSSKEEFLAKLKTAYSRVSSPSTAVPLVRVLGEMAHVIQSPKFFSDPKRENYQSYSRADFSYDLFRYCKTEAAGATGERFSLTVATRAATKKRQDFLWIPSDETGNGTVYSHIQIGDRHKP